MKKSWKRVEVTIETETVVVRGGHAVRAWCQGCNDYSMMLTPSAAARLASVTTEIIYARIATGAVHFIEVPGVMLICSHSVGAIKSE